MTFLFALFALLLFLPASAVASTYHLLLERDIALPGQTDLFLVSYPTLGDLLGSSNSTVTASQIPLSPDFSLGGFAFDGAYHLLLERDVPLPGQTDLFLVSYPTLDDLLGSSNTSVTPSQIPLSPDFSLGGFAFDGAYHLLLERDIALPGQTDLFLLSFPTLGDLVGSSNSTVTASQIPLSPDFSLGGFAYGGFPPVIPPPSEDPPSMAVIPLPASAFLLIGALLAMLGVARFQPQEIGTPQV